MPSIRIGFSTDFNLTSEQVGIGTTRPTARLDVRGQVRSDNASGSGGISTLTEYQGFLHSKQGIGNTVSIAQTTKGNLNSLSGELVISGEVTVSAGTSIGAGRLDSLTVTSSFDLPRGGSTNRPVAPEKGNTRFNQDLGQLEFYTGYEWRTVGSIDGSGRGRGVIAGGASGPNSQVIEFINISTLGNASYFGDATFSGGYRSGSSSSTRGIFATGYIGPLSTNIIEYVTIASQGNGLDFGDATTARYGTMSVSSQTRSVFAGGFEGNPSPVQTNTMDYIQISTLGDALDFGDLNYVKAFNTGCSSPTRGIFGGVQFGGGVEKTIIKITISSKGNSQDFGNLYAKRGNVGGAVSNGTRGVFAGGEHRDDNSVSGGLSKVIDYVNIASDGNAIYFGDLTVERRFACSVQSITRGLFAGGVFPISPNLTNTIDYITIATMGNAQDFGDLTQARRTHNNGASDSHGGLGGF